MLKSVQQRPPAATQAVFVTELQDSFRDRRVRVGSAVGRRARSTTQPRLLILKEGLEVGGATKRQAVLKL